MIRPLQIAALAGLLLVAPACSPNKPTTPPDTPSAYMALAGWVTDAANIIPPAREAALADKLARFERDTKHQLVVVTVPSLRGQEVDAFTTDLANRWGSAVKGKMTVSSC